MRDKVRITVLLPATRERYEFLMPFDITVECGARLASRILALRESNRYEASEEVDLVVLEGDEAGEILNPKDTFRNLVLADRIVDGTAVMLA